MRIKIKFVQLEGQAFFTDLDFITMSAAERGVYCTLLLHLYCNAGRCEFDPQALARLCNCDDFEKVWEKIAKKFQTRNGVIRHKRVTKELTRAKKFAQRQRTAGLASAKKRQPRFNHGSATVEPTKRKGNVNENEREGSSNTNTKELAHSVSTSVRPPVCHVKPLGLSHPEPLGPCHAEPSRRCHAERSKASGPRMSSVPGSEESAGPRPLSLRLAWRQAVEQSGRAMSGPAQIQGLHFNDALANIIPPRTRSDRTCFRNVTNWLVEGCAAGRFNDEIFGRVLDLAKEARGGRRPPAVFMALMKKELRYKNGTERDF